MQLSPTAYNYATITAAAAHGRVSLFQVMLVAYCNCKRWWNYLKSKKAPLFRNKATRD